MLGDNVGTAKRNHYLSVIVTKNVFYQQVYWAIGYKYYLLKYPKGTRRERDTNPMQGELQITKC